MKISTTLLLVIMFVLTFNFKSSFCQVGSSIQYISPMPYSLYVSIQNNIIIRANERLSESDVDNNLLNVYGAKSGTHLGKLILSNDQRTLIFKPYVPFAYHEKVNVRLEEGLRTIYGDKIDTLNFWFQTCKYLSTTNQDYFINNEQSILKQANISSSNLSNHATVNYPVPIITTSIDPSPGYIFTAPSDYLMILDNDGVPVFYRTVAGNPYDFTLQPDGELTYFLYPTECYGMDSSYNVINQFNTANGFAVDVHDLIVQPNGHYFILGKRLVEVDMSKIVAGGDTSAEIIDMALQEFDSTNDLIFQWDALSHYNITDADTEVDLSQHEIDFVHLNSIAIDTDSNIILSARNLDEITKIDHNTGNIIWRFGGKNNQFKFLNDDLGFSRQHDAKMMKNGDISIFDNGVYHVPRFSSFVEYRLDTTNMTATLINRYTHNHGVFGITEGDVQELPNGNKFIGWGETGNPAVTEIGQNDSIEYEMGFPTLYSSYRSFRFHWQTNLFSTNVDSLDFGKVAYGDSSVRSVILFNPHDSSITINQFYGKETSYSVMNKLPLTIPGKDTAIIKVQFKPPKHGIFQERLNIRHLGTGELIARQIDLTGSTIKQPTQINQPTDLVAKAINNSEIRISWVDNSNNEDGFIIERKNGDSLSTNDFIIIDTSGTNDTTYFDKNVSDSTKYTYKIYAYNIDTVSTFSNLAEAEIITSIMKNNLLPISFALYQNYPNPFNPSTVISYSIPVESHVKIEIFNAIGQKLDVIVDIFQKAGQHEVKWNAANMSSGIYFFSIKAYGINGKNYFQVKKMILLK